MEANNMKACREALDRIGNTAVFVAENCGDKETAKYMNYIIMDVQAALSAPARNCDCYKDADSAYIAFCGYDFAAKDISDNAFVDWLLAPADERKGVGDGLGIS